MRKLSVFNQVSLDGYFCDAHGSMSWAHKQDPEWLAFTTENASGGGVLLFGRITYDMMASYWPTPMAMKTMPVVAERMNSLPKVVFSNTMATAPWNNTKILKGDIGAQVKKMKLEPGPDMVIMGSGTIVSQLTEAGIIDEYHVVLNPIVLGAGPSTKLGAGRTMFEGVTAPVTLALKKTRAFGNGNVVLWYER